MRRLGICIVLLLVTILAVAPATAYVPLTEAFRDGLPVIASWPAGSFPVGLTVSPGASSDIPGDRELGAIRRAVDTWNGAADARASMTVLGEAPVEAGLLDGVNGVEFSDDPGLEQAGFISVTLMLTDDDGEIQEADILVNDRAFGFNTDGGEVGLDLETAMLHELGHFLGLDHSAVGTFGADGSLDEESAVMFPVPRGPGETARTLRDDDAAGLAAVYPRPEGGVGALGGRVTRQGGGAVFGAHVLAFDPLEQVLVGALTLPDGSYEIGGLPPGRYVVKVQSLADPAGPGSFAGVFAGGTLDTGFRDTFLDRTVSVTAGATVRGVDLEVR